jgi:hypothetical protein
LDAHQITVITRQALPDPIAASVVEPGKPVGRPPRGAVSMHSRLIIGGILRPLLPLDTINTSSSAISPSQAAFLNKASLAVQQ